MSASDLHVGVMGAGAIGCWAGGRLAGTGRARVTFVGRPRLAAVFAEHGLTVGDLAAPDVRIGPDELAYTTEVETLADCDAVLVCTKSAATEEAAGQLAPVIRDDALVVSLQNGLSNPGALAAGLPGRTIVPGIVSFNVRSQPGGVVRRTMDGPVQLQRVAHPRAEPLFAAMRGAGMALEVKDDLEPEQWTKLLVNLNNAVSALSGAPTVTMLASPMYRRIIAAVVDEAMAVLRTAGKRTARLRGVPIGWMPKILRLPTPLVRIVLRAQMKIDPEARSSMWEDLERRRPTEVDYLNGEIVRLASRVGVSAPLNGRIVELVRHAERSAQGSPSHGADALWAALNGQ